MIASVVARVGNTRQRMDFAEKVEREHTAAAQLHDEQRRAAADAAAAPVAAVSMS